MTKFKIGDVVILKSGGPMMTVHNLGDYSQSGGPKEGVLCVWFNNQQKNEDVFHEDTVELYDINC